MTWAEFKKCLDAKLKEMGLSEDVEIQFIDVSYPRADTFRVESQIEGKAVTVTD